MKKPGNNVIRQRLLAWLMNAVLVLSVISFSAHVSQPKSFSNEPTRTELRLTSRAGNEVASRFEVNHDRPSQSEFTHPSNNYYSRLHQIERLTAIQLKNNFVDWSIDDKAFLIHYFTYNSESDADKMRG